MSSQTIDIIQSIHPLTEDTYDQVLDDYLGQIEPNPHVRAVYQIGSIGHPGISDLDLIVVVDPVRDPFWLNQLSVHQQGRSDLVRYVFPHDVYVYDVESFKDIRFSLYANNLKLLYGEAQKTNPADDEAQRWLSLQIIFDFTASRLAQFKNIYAGGKLDARGVLLRVASIKHSYALLQNLGIELPEVADFVRRVMAARDDHAAASPQTLHDLFVESTERFSQIVGAASDYFAHSVLSYGSDVDASNVLKLNALQLLRFIDDGAALNQLGADRLNVYYPKPSFFHFLSFTRYDHLVGRRACSHLTYSGDEVYEVHAGYEATLARRLQALSNHFGFLHENRLQFAMKGNPGFVTAWFGHVDPSTRLELPASDTPPVSFSNRAGADKRLNSATHVEPFERLCERFDFPVQRIDLDLDEYDAFVDDFVTGWQQRYADKYYKKPMELFVTYKLLDPQKDDAFMDAAGGINTYLHKIDTAQKYMQNIVIGEDLRRRFGPEITYLEGDACSIPLEDASIDKISMHHSFEHFQGDSDSRFVEETQRLLKVGGKCCIIPIFLGDAYVEVSRLPKPECPFDPQATYLVDPSARLTGGPTSGDFARVYDFAAFERRVLEVIDRSRFKISMVEISIGGRSVPFEDLACHDTITKINFPYRAMVIERVK